MMLKLYAKTDSSFRYLGANAVSIRALALVFLFHLCCVSPSIAESDNLDPEETINQTYLRAAGLYAHKLTDTELIAELDKMVAGLFFVDRFAPQLLQRHWKKLGPSEQTRFKRALLKAIRRNLKSEFDRLGPNGFPPLQLKEKQIKERFAKLDYTIDGGQSKKPHQFSISLLKNSEGSWKITNIKSRKQSLLQHFYKISDKLMGDYSFSYLVAELSGEGYVVLEDFETSSLDKLPKGWTWKGKDNKKHKPYRVKSENGNKYLEATDTGESVIIGKNVKWNLKKYPFVSFRWRGKQLPVGGDERYGRSVDSAAGIYFVYKKKLGLIPESVKYVWSTTLPIGAAMRRSGTGRPWMVVAESGDKRLGEWHTYIFNLYEAYQKTFGGNPPDKPIAIGILSDANSTHSKAYADYDDLRALSKANADSGVNEILKAE